MTDSNLSSRRELLAQLSLGVGATVLGTSAFLVNGCGTDSEAADCVEATNAGQTAVVDALKMLKEYNVGGVRWDGLIANVKTVGTQTPTNLEGGFHSDIDANWGIPGTAGAVANGGKHNKHRPNLTAGAIADGKDFSWTCAHNMSESHHIFTGQIWTITAGELAVPTTAKVQLPNYDAGSDLDKAFNYTREISNAELGISDADPVIAFLHVTYCNTDGVKVGTVEIHSDGLLGLLAS